MSLNDPFFTKFDGSPDTGRVPTRLIVLGGGELSESQLRGVDHVYGQFRNACKLSASDFHTEQVKLQDGTIVHMWSLQGRDEVTVTPGDAAEEDRLPHGFAVVTNWQSATIYKRVISGPVGPTYPYWEFAGDYVPQVEAGKTIFDNQAFRIADPDADEKDYFNLPMVYNRSDKVLWDYALRGGLDTSATFVTPFNIKNSTDGSFEFIDPHYAVENKIKSVDGAILYTAEEAPIILSPEALDYPESVHYWPAHTDAEANQVALQHWRYTVISPTANVWKFRVCNERLRRIDDTTYEAIERNVVEYVTPWSKQTTVVSSTIDSTLGEDPALLFRYRATENLAPGGVGGAGFPAGGTGSHMIWKTNWSGTAAWADISGVPLRASMETAMREIVTQGASTVTDTKTLLAPLHNTIEYIPIEKQLNYPATKFWRGGEANKTFFNTDLMTFFGITGFDPFLQPNVHVNDAHIFRYDTKYDVDGTPRITAKLGWKDLRLLEGTTTGRMTGEEYTNRLGFYGSYSWVDDGVTHITKGIPPGTMADPEYGAYLISANVMSEYMADYYANDTIHGLNPTTKWEYLSNVRPTNSVSYNLTSRYVIDYDHKGHFYAAIRVEVSCTGAAWSEDLSFYKGYMKQDSLPTYTTKIWFECNWDNQSPPDGLPTEILLVEETVTRPGWEIITLSKINPWYWPFPAYIDRDCKVRVPPEPVPDEEFMMMFNTLSSHQGANPNLCCADVRPDITGLEVEKTQSQDGIEYSTVTDGFVTPHTKYVTGQLYARTFKLSEVMGSLWMLLQLEFDAVQDNFTPEWDPDRPAWYYHPTLKAALDVNRHIEVRDGGIVQWSDNLPGPTTGYPPTPEPPPAATGREINLYRV